MKIFSWFRKRKDQRDFLEGCEYVIDLYLGQNKKLKNIEFFICVIKDFKIYPQKFYDGMDCGLAKIIEMEDGAKILTDIVNEESE